jgi:hypothetical protein
MRFINTIVLLIWINWAGAQTNNVPAIIKRLSQVPGSVNVHSYNVNNIIDLNDLPKNFKHTGQEITKNRQGVFLQPLGTGRLYQLKQIADSLVWIRLDSTIYTGYNFGALFFSLDTTLYSFAGQGFFNHNGNLRYFNEVSKEWDAVNLSKTVLWLGQNGLFYSIDTTNKQLYIESLPLHQDQAIKNRFIPDLEKSLWKLNLKTGEWSNLGSIIKDRTFVMAETPFGTLINFTHIVNLNNNKIYLLSKSLSNKITNALGTSSKPVELAYSFCVDSTLYMGDVTSNYMDSVVISRNDLTETNEPFYNPIPPELPLKEREVLIGFIILLGASSILLFLKLNNKNKSALPINGIKNIQEIEETEVKKKDIEPQVVFRSGKLLELLNEREKTLLSFIYEHSLEERLTTIEEINRVIGASQRNPEVQKRLRSDLIGTINDKLEIIAESKSSIIDKQRSDFDKRSFEYFIRPEHMQLVEKVLGKKG